MSKRYLTATAAAILALGVASSWAQAPATPATTPPPATGAPGAMPPGGAMQQPEAGMQQGQAQTGKQGKQQEKVARADRKFVDKAAQDGQFEIQAAQIAATKATDPAIKAYANELVRDHEEANAALRQVASNAGIELPAKLSRSERSKLETLQKKNGAEFDQYYVKEVVKGHKRDVKTFEKEASKLKDQQIKTWAERTLPTLQKHLAQAEALPEAGGKASTRMGAGGATQGGASTSGGASGSTTR